MKIFRAVIALIPAWTPWCTLVLGSASPINDHHGEGAGGGEHALPTATVDGGVIIGTTTSVRGATVGVDQYLGIPFASAPIGTGRFSTPKPTGWSEPLETREFGATCIQVFNPYESRDFIQDVYSPTRPRESEDCLYLNVFAPQKSSDCSDDDDDNLKDDDDDSEDEELLPVLFWLYGGGFKLGSTNLPIYSGAPFAALENVIVVSANYRTNVFGFPSTPAITNLTERNLGLLDQRAALAWVQRNIEAFGGDPDKVTIFGQSAGGYAVDVLLTSPWADDDLPFQAAIMQSGTYSYNPLPNCNNTNFAAWDSLLNHTNCTSSSPTKAYQCILDTPVDMMRYAQEKYGITFGMAGDNVTIVCDPRLRREAGKFAKVPVIGGSNVEDGSYYAAKNGTDIDRYFNVTFPGETELKAKVLAAYDINPAEGRWDNMTRLTQIHTDWNFHCPAVFLSNSSTRYTPTYRYLFNATFPNNRLPYPSILPDNRWPLTPNDTQGAYHASEIPLVFSTYNRTNATREQKELSNVMRRAWANFARDPWTAPIEGWGVSGANGSWVMNFGTDGKAGVGFGVDRTGKCDVWKDFIWGKHF
ncbi:alpha/beta-hydrolase [Byssothecium circinans]|uniref:Carboxylic ester hydrolase n=1 Tax=Byssothecium circinans TaxID=147558 RepID=A0A6A5T9Q0_9PLEO|nr:alpha/beta-hydrolase [Byssothecium circinans]